MKSGAFKAVADLAGGWVAAGDDDPWLSSDGTTWTRKPLPESPRLLYGMLNMVGAAKLLLFGSVGDGAEFWTSTDRVNWVKVPEQASLGDHTTGHPSSRYVWDATWDGTTIVAIGKQTDPTPAGALENREPLVWLSADLGTTWQTVTPPAASGYEAILLSRIFHWGGLWTITGNGRIPATGVVDPLAWTSPDGRTWTLQGSGESINTSGAGDKFSGVQALAGCNGGFSTGAGSTSNRARLWSYSTLGTWSAITTSAFDADPTSGLLGIDNPCSDYDVLVGWAENGGVRVAAAWTYGPP